MTTKDRATPKAELSGLEARVMKILWNTPDATAEDVRRSLRPSVDLSDSSVRTILRRLEAKRYVAHSRRGKSFVYRAIVLRPRAAAAAARRIIDTICGGSAASLLLGLLQSEMISAEEMEKIRDRLERGVEEDE